MLLQNDDGANQSITWQIPLSRMLDVVEADIPNEWIRALRAVSHDLRFQRHGREIALTDLVWNLALGSDDSVAIGMYSTTGSISSFLVNNGTYTLSAPEGTCTVWVAETVQDSFGRYEFIQWPSTGLMPATPQVVAGEAVWIEPDGHILARIGELQPADNHETN